MFESEDFDLDEDFLEDIGKKEEEYYSQQNPTSQIDNDPPPKRQKTESLDSDFFSDITFDDEPDFAKTVQKQEEKTAENDDVSMRKKRTLEIFSSKCNSINSQNLSQKNSNTSNSPSQSKKSPETSLYSKTIESSRKALALEILRKGSLKTSDNQESIEKLPQKSSKNEENPSIDKNVNVANFPKKTIERTSETFKKPAEKISEISRKTVTKNPPKFSSRDRGKSAPRMTLIRRFPGPAGLLPDNFESNLDHANFLNSLGDFGVDENHEESKISDYCSQNTERLFTSGAWRSMLDDLPANFLKGREIATIKRLGRESWEKSRVSFVAGVVHKIDQSVDNPRLILKDMTDSIEATIHSDFSLAHPNILEPGVVILLRNVGLLGFQGSQKCPGLQYHLMISPSNVMAIYSEKSRIFADSSMDLIDQSTDTLTFDNGIDSSISVKDENDRKILSERNSGIFDNMEIIDFESEDDEKNFGFFNLGDLNEETSTSFSKNKNFMKSSLEDEKIGNFEGKRKIDERKSAGDNKFAKVGERNQKNSNSPEIVIKPKAIEGVRSRLLQFRSNDVLTPPILEDKTPENLSSNSKIVGNSSKDNDKNEKASFSTFGDDLLASDEDTEDEILSQLDVDSIMTNYNAGS